MIGERLVLLQNKLKFKNRKSFSEFLKISYSTMKDYETRGKIPSEILNTIIEKTGVSAEWLITGKGEMFGENGNNLSGTLQTLISAAKTNPAIKTLLLNALNADDESERKSYIEALNMLLKNA